MSDLKSRILTAALEIAAQRGLAATTRNAIADRAGCSMGSVSYHFGEGRKLSRAIVEAAIERVVLPVIGAAVAEKHPAARAVAGDLLARALRAWIGR